MKSDKNDKRQPSQDKTGLLKPADGEQPQPDLKMTKPEKPAEFGERQAAVDMNDMKRSDSFNRQSVLEKAGLVDPAENDLRQPVVKKARQVKPAETSKVPSALEKAGLLNPEDNVEEESIEEDTGLLRSTVPEYEINNRRGTLGQQRLRSDQVRLIQRQANTELVISMLVCAVVAFVLWGAASPVLLTGWATAVILSVGSRSLFISGRQSENSHDEFNAWGTKYIVAIILSGSCWGGLGVFSVLNAGLIQQVFVLFVLAGICLTAYVSLQSSTKTTAAFILPALLPMTACLIYEGLILPTSLSTLSTFTQENIIQLALAILTFTFAMVMQFSSKTMQTILVKSMKLGSHNTELIKRLVVTGEAAERAKSDSEKTNIELQKQMKERAQAEERIRVSEKRMSAIFDGMQDTIYQTDCNGTILWTTPSIEHLLGYTVKEAMMKNILELYVNPDDHEDLIHELDTNHGRLQHFETRLQHKDGSQIWILENTHYRYDKNKVIIGIEGTIRDITALKQAKEELHQEKERAHVTLGSIGDGVITTDLGGDIEYMNAVAEYSTGWKLEDARGKPIMDAFSIVDEKTQESPPNPADQCLKQGKSIMLSGHLLLIHRHREERLSVEVNASPIRDSNANIMGVVLVFHDVTELRGLARKMSYQASHDSLTGLINRREFEKRIKQVVENARTEDTRHTLCYMDLDNFKVVNDTCGHSAGDELLKQITIKLRMDLREADTLARLGGDEFGILFDGCSIENAREPADIIRKIVEEFRFSQDDKVFRIGASIGLAAINKDSGSLSDVLSAADSACYIAKEQGRNRIHVYQANDEAMVERSGQMQWVQRLQDTLEQDRFRLFFQPIQNLHTASADKGKLHGEVLVRMLDEDNQLVAPGSFIPSAERYGLMPAIDRWVVSNTFRMLVQARKTKHTGIMSCSINLSGQSLSDDRFNDFLVNEISSSGVSPSELCFEITETAVIGNLCNASKLISSLREMGCKFALDDFGVGLSSFSYLKSLAVDYLKLDGYFVKNMVTDTLDRSMVEAINKIGHSMNIETIAEFVEDEKTLAAVREVGIDYAQGYIIGKPVPFEISLYQESAETSGQSHPEQSGSLKSVSGE
ncbi:MAG: EAL domain-containing protein [Gammaproteobacteria bacterium]|nr:EAL domain-containing protein [Gammaproteobacteria bacterium]